MVSYPPPSHSAADARSHRRDHHYRHGRSSRRAHGSPSAVKTGGRLDGGCAHCGGGGTPLPVYSERAAAAGAAAGCGSGRSGGDGGRGGTDGGGSALLAPVRVATAAAAVLFMATAVVVVMVAGPAQPLLAARFSPLAARNGMGVWTVSGASTAHAAAAAEATSDVRSTSPPPPLAQPGARHHTNSAAEACAAAALALLTPDHGKHFWGEGGSTGLKRKLGTFRAQLAATDGQSVVGEAATTTSTTATPVATRGATAAAAPATVFSHRARPVVVDVGANEGQSFTAWRRAYAAPRIYAVEGNPDTADRLAVALAREAVVDADATEAGGQDHPEGGVALLQSLVGNATREATFRRSREAGESQTSGLWPDGAPQRDGQKFDYIVRWGTVRQVDEGGGGWWHDVVSGQRVTGERGFQEGVQGGRRIRPWDAGASLAEGLWVGHGAA